MSSSTSSDLDSLQSKVTSLSALLQHFNTTLSATISDAAIEEDAPRPLHVLRDASTLLKAQTTKLSLILINPPFTPSAVISILRSCEGECIPGMMAAWEIILSQNGLWPAMAIKEIKGCLQSTVNAFGELLVLVATKTEEEKQGSKLKERKERNEERVCGATGLVWKACESVGELAANRMPELLVRKVEMWKGLIKDAIQELKEWREESVEDEDDDDTELGFDEDGVELFQAANKLPKGRKDIEERLEEALRKLRLTATLYQTVVKVRLTTSPNEETKGDSRREFVVKVDRLMEDLEKIPETVDELASAFYELDVNEIDLFLEQISSNALSAANEIKMNWDGKEDMSTTWICKWKDAMKPKTAVSKPG